MKLGLEEKQHRQQEKTLTFENKRIKRKVRIT